jgi:hypothetical protein
MQIVKSFGSGLAGASVLVAASRKAPQPGQREGVRRDVRNGELFIHRALSCSDRCRRRHCKRSPGRRTSYTVRPSDLRRRCHRCSRRNDKCQAGNYPSGGRSVSIGLGPACALVEVRYIPLLSWLADPFLSLLYTIHGTWFHSPTCRVIQLPAASRNAIKKLIGYRLAQAASFTRASSSV